MWARFIVYRHHRARVEMGLGQGPSARTAPRKVLRGQECISPMKGEWVAAWILLGAVVGSVASLLDEVFDNVPLGELYG